MRISVFRILFFLIAFPFFSMAQHQLTISVNGVPSSKGSINVGVYNTADGFLKPESIFSGKKEKAQKGTTTIVLEQLPTGTYALALYHDENDNDELDTNLLGIPKEALGFSKGKLKTFGPPDYDECVFKVDSDTSISIPLK
ncbi:DUF2141 domain-containing protein [Maribacter sp. 2-571]|uniref:DUF2141 domain-containing protein n=1 Tax=Maribacter sp. 2-571 TaxID=3417569 RepID=UPI003D33A0B0